MYKIKVVAIAKDEGAYVAEWCAHYLALEFDAIEVLVNRTTDGMVDILEKISARDNRVTYRNCDWIDLCMNGKVYLQEVLYANAYQRAKGEGFSHVLFVDIDEFWLSLDLNVTIKQHVDKYIGDDSSVYRWFNQCGNSEFEHPIENLYGEPSQIVKSLVSCKKEVKFLSIHTPGLASEHKLLDCNGVEIPPLNGRGSYLFGDDDKVGEFFIFHRMYRSEMEYVSSLIKGQGSGVRYKLNRFGYKNKSLNSSKLKLLNKDDYTKKVSAILDNFESQNKLEDARNFVRARYEDSILYLEGGIKQYGYPLVRAFSGISDPRVKELVSSFKRDDEKNESTDSFWGLTNKVSSTYKAPDMLRDIALCFEQSGDIELALSLMEKALELRPNGPFIINKVNEYKAKA